MRQTRCLYIATAVAALAMSCVLPYATRASLNPDGTIPHPSLQTFASPELGAAAAPFNLISGEQSVDLSMFTPRGFLALSKNLNGQTAWPSSNPSIAKPSAPPKKVQASLGTFHTSPYDAGSVERIAFSKPVLAPVAFVRFCTRYPDDCKDGPIDLDRAPVQLTKERWAELEKINRDVNRAIRPEANPDGVVGEQWLIAPRYGDCNDYAVTKRHELLARGWPAHSLLLTEVVVASGEHHLIVVVRTSEGDFVLDNLSAYVRPVFQIEYEWVRAQRTENTRFWSAINVARADRVAMNSR